MEIKGSSKSSDEKLLLQLKKGNRVAFNELYLRYWEELYRFGYSIMKDESGTKDILQDIFLAIWKNREDQHITNLRSYLMKSVKFAVTRALRNGGLSEEHQEYLHALPTNNIEEKIDLEDLEEEVKTILENLPHRSREVFYLSRFKHLSNKEISEYLGISKRTVEWHISNALQELKFSINRVATVFFSILLLEYIT